MIKKHPDLREPNDETVIWKYLSLAKFLFLLKKEELHFHRIDCFPDKNEGLLTIIDKKMFYYDEGNNAPMEYWERERKRYYISCWIESPHELNLMWDRYSNEGIAIKTTVANLKKSLEKDVKHVERISKVKYVDYEKESSQDFGTPKQIYKIMLTKRNYFEQEKEIRLILFKEIEDDGITTGVNVPIYIEPLLQEIWISPKADTFIAELIKREISFKNLNPSIVQKSHI